MVGFGKELPKLELLDAGNPNIKVPLARTRKSGSKSWITSATGAAVKRAVTRGGASFGSPASVLARVEPAYLKPVGTHNASLG